MFQREGTVEIGAGRIGDQGDEVVASTRERNAVAPWPPLEKLADDFLYAGESTERHALEREILGGHACGNIDHERERNSLDFGA